MAMIFYIIILLVMAAGIPTATACFGDLVHLNSENFLILLAAVLLISFIPLAFYFNYGKKKFGENHRHIVISSAVTALAVYIGFYLYIYSGLTPPLP